MQACVSGEQFDGIKMGWIFFGSRRWMRYCPHQCRCPRAFLTLGLRGCRVAGAFVYGRTAFRSCVNHLNFSITSAQRSRFISQVPFAFAFASRSRSHWRGGGVGSRALKWSRPYGPSRSSPRLCTTIIVQDICFYSLCSESDDISFMAPVSRDLSSENQINCTARLMTTCPGNKNKLFRPRHKSFSR